jgi:hypothetical protein
MCNNGHFEEIFVFNEFPVYMGTTKQLSSADLTEDMSFVKCTACGTVQLNKLIPLSILYKDSHAGVVGKTWERHHTDFCNFVSKYIKGNVLEIGGSNLMVANMLAKNPAVDQITVVDNQIYVENLKSDKIVPCQKFFDAAEMGSDVDCVIHTHLIEHLYDPIIEFKKISSALSDGSYMMFAAPLIDNMLEDNFTNAMNFEHTYLLTDKKIACMMKASNFEIVDKMNFSKYAAFYVCRKNTAANDKPILNMHIEDESIINSFIDYHQNEIQHIQRSLTSDRQNTFIFGAHIFTQYLFGFGLQESAFCRILDNDPKKINNRLYGTDLMVSSPKILRHFREPTVVLKAAQYTEEIKKDIIENINPNTRFIL